MSISPAQCRAARGFLDMSSQKLAVSAGVSLATVARFEIGRGHPINSTVTAIEAALVRAGIDFCSPPEMESVSVRPK